MTKQVNQSTLNVVLVAALGVMTSVAGVGIASMALTVRGEAREAKQMATEHQVKSDEKHDAMMAVLHAMEKRLTILETKQEMQE